MPGEAARLGLDFLAAKVPHASPKVIMDFLRSMNKVKSCIYMYVYTCMCVCLFSMVFILPEEYAHYSGIHHTLDAKYLCYTMTATY